MCAESFAPSLPTSGRQGGHRGRGKERPLPLREPRRAADEEDGQVRKELDELTLIDYYDYVDHKVMLTLFLSSKE